jgi:hypothetical protein
MHLSPDRLIDIAEGAQPESAEPHLRACGICRDQVALLRGTMSAAADVDVPEPSPFFWEQLSRRVRTAVASEDAPRGSRARFGFGPRWSWPAATIVAVAAAVLIAVALTVPRSAPDPPAAGSDDVDLSAVDEAAAAVAADDPSLALMADLANQLDPDALSETTWTDHADAIDHAVSSLTLDERLELQRLLEEALVKRGA